MMQVHRITAWMAATAFILMAWGCAGAPVGAGMHADATLAGRWSGSFMSNQGGRGGTARMVIDQQGRVRGSITDTVGTHAGADVSPSVGTLQGTVHGSSMQVEVAWAGGGSVQKYRGTCMNPGVGSLGVNLKPDGGGASGELVLSLHEQGVSGQPPFGVPAATVQPDFQKRWTGTWTVNWFDGGPDYGTGTVRISPDGTVDGALVDDAFNTAEWNQPVHATLKGRIGPDGSIDAGIAWSSGRSGWGLTGKAHFTGPETFQVQFSPTGTGDEATRSVTMTFHR
jgi:hypothetical protein